MKLYFKIIKWKNKVITEEVSINVEYAVPSTDLYIAYTSTYEKGTRKELKIDHLIQGNIKYENIEFDVTIAVVITNDESVREIGADRMLYFIIAEEGTPNYRLEDCVYYFFDQIDFQVISAKNI
jgi:hypothetical protein